MDRKSIESHVQALRQALMEGEREAVREHQDWLMGTTAVALLDQDLDGMMVLRRHFPYLASLANKHGTGGPGERWNALWEVLEMCTETHRPLEQVRLAEPARLSGRILHQIRNTPGIMPSELARLLKKTRNHISNEIKLLARQGLVHRVTEGRNQRLYLSSTARELLQRFPSTEQAQQTVAAEEQPPKDLPLHHIGKDRSIPPDYKRVPGVQLLETRH